MMSPQLRAAYQTELTDYNRHRNWVSLERAHVLSQAYAGAHVYVHWRMLVHALGQANARESLGQFARLLLAAPGSWLERAPVGNTGGANVGIFQPMTVSSGLRDILLTDRRSAGLIKGVGADT